jgi:hypothetical protein
MDMKNLYVAVAAASAFLTASAVFADTIAYWSFDEGVVSNNATTLSSKYNPTIMTATASSNGGGPIPQFSGDIGLDSLIEGAEGTAISTNSLSLKFTNSGLPGNLNSSNGGVLTIPHNAIMVLSNLTAEAFVRMDRLVNYPLIIGKARESGDTTWNIDMDDTGKPRLRIDSYPVGGTKTQGINWNQSVTSSVGINDGKWHHVAFTYTHATKRAAIYVDYVERGFMITGSNLVYTANEMRIGQGAGGRAFDGWIDEVRISDEVLQPAQFLMAPEGETYAYWSFDDGAPGTYADILTNSFFVTPTINPRHGTAGILGAGGVKPQFTNDLPSAAKMMVRDGATGETVNSNTAALFFRNSDTSATPLSKLGSVVNVIGPYVPEFPTNFTVECFTKADRAAQWPQIIGKNRSNGGTFSWSLGCQPNGTFRCRFDTTSLTNSTVHHVNQVIQSGVNIYDGQWHHLAMTYHYPTKTARLYVDYELRATQVTTYPMYLDNGNIVIGAGDNNYDGAIDEVRITKRVLQPDEFLYLDSPPPPLYPVGTLILVN